MCNAVATWVPRPSVFDLDTYSWDRCSCSHVDALSSRQHCTLKRISYTEVSLCDTKALIDGPPLNQAVHTHPDGAISLCELQISGKSSTSDPTPHVHQPLPDNSVQVSIHSTCTFGRRSVYSLFAPQCVLFHSNTIILASNAAPTEIASIKFSPHNSSFFNHQSSLHLVDLDVASSITSHHEQS